jgi:hypothetical protein
MKKIAQSTITLLMVLFLSIGSTALAQQAGDGGQGGTDTGPPKCDPLVRACPAAINSSTANSASNVAPQVGTVALNGQMTDSVFFDLLLLFIQVRLVL